MDVFNFDSELNAFLIRSVTKAYNHKALDQLDRLGVSLEMAEMISNLPLRDAEKLSLSRGCIGDAKIMEDIVQLKLRNMQHEDSRDKLYDKLIQMGASHAMMYDLSGMDVSEFRARRKKIGLPKASAGRPSALSDSESTAVQNAWHRYKDEEDDLVRLVYVGCETKIPLSRIWQFLKAPDDYSVPSVIEKKLKLVSTL